MCGVDPWLRDESNPFITSVCDDKYARLRVADLITPGQDKWNEELIQRIFNQRDVAEILKIPVTLLQNKDAPIWRFSNNERHINEASGYVELVFTLIHELDKENMVQVAMILWTIWWWRTQKCWNDTLPSVLYVNSRAKEALDDRVRVRITLTQHRTVATLTEQQNWIKPQQGTLKCNVDAVCYVAENKY
ncbi:hypothetical protein A2U01_0012627 [Trifolium medium]|uniref:Uncharacterized protein n=1 Tax=Trifolium medium TaxID=97028 RepID=A0A392MYC8_9FABA|nr:hypothetical protein [Trifolium medium]